MAWVGSGASLAERISLTGETGLTGFPKQDWRQGDLGCVPARYWHNLDWGPSGHWFPQVGFRPRVVEHTSTQHTGTGLPLDSQEGNATEWRGRGAPRPISAGPGACVSSGNAALYWILSKDRGVDVGGITVQKAHCRYSHSERNVPNAWVPPLACSASGFLTQETGSLDSHRMTPYSMLIRDKRCCIRDSTDETQRENKKDKKGDIHSGLYSYRWTDPWPDMSPYAPPPL